MTWDPDWRGWPSWQLIIRHPFRSVYVRFWGPNGRFQLRKKGKRS